MSESGWMIGEIGICQNAKCGEERRLFAHTSAPQRWLCSNCATRRARAVEADALFASPADREKHESRKAEARTNHREYMRARRKERIAAGMCTECGKSPSSDGTQRCAPCRRNLADSNSRRRLGAYTRRVA